MADVEVTVKPGGTPGVDCTYASLSAAEADDFGASSGQSVLCTCIEGSVDDTTAVTINTSVPSSIEITVAASSRHDGDVSAGYALVPSSGAAAISVYVPVTIRHVRIDCTNVTEGIYFYDVSGASTINNLFIHDVPSGRYGVRIQYNASNVVTAYRCIASSQASSGAPIAFYLGNSATLNAYFCTGYATSTSYVAFRNASGTFNVYGCIGFGRYPFYGTFGGGYNADNTSNSSYQAPGSNSLHNLTVADNLTDVSSDDFTVKDTDADIYNAGYDYGSPYTDADIAGNSMSGTPDIGAFEYVVASGGYDLTAESGSFSLTGTAANLLRSTEVAAGSGSFSLSGTDASLLRSLVVLAESAGVSVGATAAGLLRALLLTAGPSAYALAGTDATLTYTPINDYDIVAGVGEFALSGADASLVRNAEVAAGNGSFALSGEAASLLRSLLVAAASAGFSITGAAAGLLRSIGISAEAAAYVLTGTDITLTYSPVGSYNLPADPGAFALSGAAAILLASRRLAAGAASFTLSGAAVGVFYDRLIDAAAGDHTIAGTDAALIAARALSAASGEVQVAGAAAGLHFGYALPAEATAFALTGIAAALLRDSVLTVEAGAITITGTAADLGWSGLVLPSGAVTITFAAAAPGVAFTAAVPGVTFTT